MNKLFICLFFMLLPAVCRAENVHWVNAEGQEVSDEEIGNIVMNGFMAEVQRQAKDAQPVYENMKTCAPAKSEYLQVLGMENDLCHFTYANYDCLFPLDVAKQYAQAGLKFVEEALNGNFSTDSPENDKIQEILSNENYCSQKAWSVTVVDEDGNEISTEEVTFE